jgi:hypothetical protein
MAAPVDLELKKVKRGFQQAAPSPWRTRGLWTGISREARALKKERGSWRIGDVFLES